MYAILNGLGQSQVLHANRSSRSHRRDRAVVGRNGMGKSTLVKSLIGVDADQLRPDRDHTAATSALPSHPRVAQGLAYVPQGRQIFGTMTVEENIDRPIRRHRQNTQ